MNPKEEKDIRIYARCDNIQEREDVIFVYPDEFSNNPNITADLMQEVMNYLRQITEINPTIIFAQRVVVGYRHLEDIGGHKTQPNWIQNRVSIPWGYLIKPDEPLACCAHELVHPFFRCSPLHNKNEGWGEGFCEFLRGPIKKILGSDGENWWKKMIKCFQDGVNSSYCYPAGQFVIKAYSDYALVNRSRTIKDLINDQEAIRDFVKFLFDSFEKTSLSTYFTPSPKMKEKWAKKGKI